ncbi:calcium-binding protein [Citrobacter tructae]|uniref:calcium-binding protein n=1 Tax=Citrobacter tructae TaxID=2562449 RepID=UPI003F55ED28
MGKKNPVDLSYSEEVINITTNLLDELAIIDSFTGMGGSVYYTDKNDLIKIQQAIDDQYLQICEAVYRSLIIDTRLAPYYEAIEVNSLTDISFAPMIVLFESNFNKDPMNTFIDLGEILSFEENTESLTSLYTLFDTYLHYAIDNQCSDEWIAALGTSALKSIGFTVGTPDSDNLSGTELNDSIYGNTGSDVIKAAAGDDLIWGYTGNDTLNGDDGNDLLNGGDGDDILNGGNDSDTYIFRAGHGHDTVTDKSSTAINSLVFGGAQSDQLQMQKSGNNLIIQAYGTDDAVTVYNFFASDDYTRFSLVFDDRTVTMEELVSSGFPVYGTDNAETLSGWDNNDTLYGYAGNDTLNGSYGNDRLDGGTGDDKLNGGNDSDTYIFRAGHGHDTVTDKSSTAINSLVFEGALSGQLQMQKSGNNLIIQVYGTDDAVTVYNFFASDDYTRFSLVFDDRTVTMEELVSSGFPAYGTDNAETLSGWDNNDTLYGYAGNDTLNGSYGNDRLDGGTGDDKLNGGNDSDTYIFRAGHGHDTVTDKSSTAINSLVFEGALSGQLQMQKSGNNLIIQAYGTDDAVTVYNFFASDDYTRFSLVFDDRTVTMEELVSSGFPVYGTDNAETLSGWDNNDTLYGYAGNDTLNGSYGNDRLDGGTGDDKFNGGNDSDTYIFRAGHGHDTVTDKSSTAINSLVFEGALSGQLQMQKSGNNLIIQAYGTDDAVTVYNFFASDDYTRFSLVFDDRTIAMEELPEFVTETLVKNDSLATQEENTLRNGLSSVPNDNTQQPQVAYAAIDTTADSSAQLNQLINAMASFGNAEEGVGLTGSSRPNDYNQHYLTIPQ